MPTATEPAEAQGHEAEVKPAEPSKPAKTEAPGATAPRKRRSSASWVRRDSPRTVDAPAEVSEACEAVARGSAGRARLASPAGAPVTRPLRSQEILPWRPPIPGRRSSSSTSPGSRAPGTTSPPTCPSRLRRRSIPATHQPIGPDDLAPLFPMALIGQEVSTEREIEIPEPVRDAYRLYRPSPLYRAHRLEQALDTPAHIYYKYEGVSPAGSHKPNTAIAQAFYNKEAGRQAPRDRDRRRPVGERAGLRGRAVRARGQGLHGPRQLRPEAVPADPDGDLRRGGRGQPVA